VTTISVSGNAPNVGASSQFTATALSNSTTQAVTSQATWTSSDTSVATVSSTGLVTGVNPGSADISATYQNVTGVSHLAIVRLTFAVFGTVRDGSSNALLPNIHVSSLDSAGVTTTATTNSSGAYSLEGVATGVVAITFSATGYQTTTQSTTVTTYTQVNLSLPRVGGGLPPSPTTPNHLLISPSEVIVQSGGTQQFSAIFFPPGSDESVTWSVAGAGCSGAGCGTIDATGRYTAPATPPNPAVVTVTARSVADSTRSADATVAIGGVLSFSMNPSSFDFGSRTVNTTSAPTVITLTNTSSTPQPVTPRPGGLNYTDFATTSNCPSMIAVGASCTFTITFSPSATGRRIGILDVDGTFEDMGEVSLFGTGTN